MMGHYCQFRIAATALFPALLIACSDTTANTGADKPHEVVVTTADFTFSAPDTIPAGLTRISLVNEGPEDHQVLLVRLADGHTFRQLLDSVAAGNPAPAFVTPVGGPNPPAPGASSEVTIDLPAGQYAMLCLIPSVDGVPHFAKGMVRPLTVTPSSVRNQPEPVADVRMVLDDFSFTFAPELRAGRRTIRVENAGAQPHELVIIRLAPGKTLEDVRSFFEQPTGPLPGVPNSGTVDIAPGLVNFVTADFPPGEYVLLCLVPDGTDGRPHMAHDMIRQIRVE